MMGEDTGTPADKPAAAKYAATYILPLRWSDDGLLESLATYLERLIQWLDVIVVDGSPPDLFAAHGRRFPPGVRHVPVVPSVGENGKVAAIMKGVRIARTDALVLADDDVRYDAIALEQVLLHLHGADIVRPQNYFLSLPWHARWDTGRALINRAFGADFPGTLAVRRGAMLATDGYDSRVLFENLELLRTITAGGGVEARANAVFVGRISPSVRHFRTQRVRQAYDDFAQPLRLVTELALLPLLIGAAATGTPVRRGTLLFGALVATVGVAEVGRRRHDGARVFGNSSALWAPLWVLERSICIWFANALRLTGGIQYAGSRLVRAANSKRRLCRRHGGKITPTGMGRVK
jgi:hypothetical protein